MTPLVLPILGMTASTFGVKPSGRVTDWAKPPD